MYISESPNFKFKITVFYWKMAPNLHRTCVFQALPALHIAAPRIPVDPVPGSRAPSIYFNKSESELQNTPTNCEMLYNNKQNIVILIYIYIFNSDCAGSYYPILHFFWSKSKSPTSKQHFDLIFFFYKQPSSPKVIWFHMFGQQIILNDSHKCLRSEPQ